MTRTSFDQPLDLLERHFQALQERAANLPEASRTELETALQGLSQAIAALRAGREAGASPPAAVPGPCEAMLRHVFSAIPDLLTVIDQDFNIVMSNWYHQEHISEEERRGRPKCYRVYVNRDRPCESCQGLEVFTTGEPRKLEWLSPIDGKNVEIHAFPIFDESGRVVLVAEHVRDITERHLAEQALRESEGRFRTLIEDSPESLFLTDTQGTVLAASRIAAQRLGKNLDQVIGALSFDLFPPEVAARRRAFFEQAIAAARPVRLEDARGGRHFDIHFNPILDADGKVSRLSVLGIDITDRKNAEQALKESETTLRALIEANPESLFLLDTRGVILAASHVGAQRLGKSLEEIIGTDLHGMLPPEVGKKRFEIMQRVVATGQPARFEDVRGDFCFDSSITPIFDRDKVVQVAVLGVDISLRKLAKAAVQESEARFRAIFATAQDSIFIKDRSFKYTQVNPAMGRLFGRPAAEIIGKTDLDMVGAADTERIWQQDRQVLNGEVVKGAHTVTVQGVPITFHYIKAPLHDDAGEIVGICGIARDISDLKEAEAALEESEERFRMLFDHAPDAYILADMQGEIIDCNQATEKLAGYGRDELIGNNFACLPWLDFRQQVRLADLLAQTARGEVMGPVDFTLTRKDGGEVIAEGMSLPLYIQGQNLVLTIIRDITARKQAEAGLRESEQRFRDITENAAEWVWEADSQGKYTYSSPVVEQLLGYKPKEILGKYFYDFFLPDEREELKHATLAAFAAKQPFREFLNLNLHKDGRTVQLSTSGIPLLDEQGNLLGYRGADIDITARKQAEAGLRKSEELFRSLVEHITLGITLISSDYRIIMTNPAQGNLFHKHPREFINKECFREFEKRPAVCPHCPGAIAMATGQKAEVETTVVRDDGSTLVGRILAFPSFGPDGEVNGFIEVVEDITQSKQAEEALAAHLQFLQLLLDTIPNPIFFKDTQGAYLGCNKAFEDFLGITRQEIVGKNVYDLSPPELADEYHRMDLAAFQTTGTQVYESRVRTADGARRHVVFHKATFPDPTGGLGGLVGIITDITGLKQAETKLRESEQRFRLMAETIQDVFWIATPRIGRTLYVSPGFEYIWGRTSQALYHNPKLYLETVHPEDRERVKIEIIAARKRSIPWSHEYRIIRPDGTTRWIQNRGFPVRDDQGRVTLFTGVATDITEHKALEGQLLQAQKMEAVGRLAGGVAHDFNNLLMAITGYGELMRAKVLKDDPLYGYLENILNAGDRAAALTQQLLTFSRRQIVHPKVVDLNRVVLDLEPMLGRLIGEDLDLEAATDRRPAAVKADPNQMGQIIMNLVVNARDAMPQGGRLTLKTTPVDFKRSHHTRFGQVPPGAYVMLEVADTGVGMNEATQAHVFEPFFTTKAPGKGTGLGLSTVYGIVKQSGGYLDLASAPGAGSTFTIYFPRLEAIVEPPTPKIPLTASFRGEETVLLVEDEDVLRGLLAKFLRIYGYTVLEARHGGEALLTCERHQGPIHLMVTDVVMPQMSGRELADRLTPLRPEMKVLFMSGYTEDALVQHGVTNHSVAFLQKPFKPIELARRVFAILHPPVNQ